MAVPKKRQSNTRRNKRRANHDRAPIPSVGECPNCQEPVLPHRVCAACGTYNGRKVLDVGEE